MAAPVRPRLQFTGNRPDPGVRTVPAPAPLPTLGDDLDWDVRDFDSLRRFMLEELAARFPERTRWSPADFEVVLIEALAAVLDEYADAADRIFWEAFLETAERPESVRRLLAMIGYDAGKIALARGQIAVSASDDPSEVARALEAYWRTTPDAMDAARAEGPAMVTEPRRMVTNADHAALLEAHPLVLAAHAWTVWTGSWLTTYIAVICFENLPLATPLSDTPEVFPRDLRDAATRHHLIKDLPPIVWPSATNARQGSRGPTVGSVLASVVASWRMAGREVVLVDAEPVGIGIDVTVRCTPTARPSDVRVAVETSIGRGPEGLFAPGRLRFGDDLYASDIIARLAGVSGVDAVALNRFGRLDGRSLPSAIADRLVLSGLEVAVCDNRADRPERGFVNVTLIEPRR